MFQLALIFILVAVMGFWVIVPRGLEPALVAIVLLAMLWSYTPVLTGAGGSMTIFVTKFAGWGLLSVRVFRPLLLKAKVLRLDFLHAAWLAFTGYVLFTAAYSEIPYYTLQRAISLALLVMGTYWALWGYISDWKKAGEVVAIVAGIGLLAIATSAILLLAGYSGAFDAGRFAGSLGNANTVGSVVGLTAGPLWYLGTVHKSRLLRITMLFSLGLGVALTLLSESRAGLAGLVVAAAVILLGPGRPHQKVWAGLLTVAIIFAVLELPLGPYLPSLAERFEVSNVMEARLPLWQTAVDVAARSPALGYGFGTAPVLVPMGPHNTLLTLLLEVGLIGLALFAVVVMAGLSQVAKALSASAVREHKPLAVACLSVTLAGLTNGLFESWWTSAGSLEGGLFWVTFMVGARLARLPVKGAASVPAVATASGGGVGGR